MALPSGLQPKTLVSLSQSEIVPPPSYIEPSVLPVGGQLILASQAKTGKSFIMIEMGRALACADRPFTSQELYCPRACRVLLIEQELGEAGLKKRIEKIYTREEISRQGFMADNFLYVSQQPDIKLDTVKGLKVLTDICDEVQPDVLMLDPLGRFHNVDENNAQAVSGLWDIIDKLRKTYPGMAFITSMHMSKPPDARAGIEPLDPYRIRGSGKFFDNPDAILTTMRTHNLATQHKSWSVSMRFTLRHGESPDDMILHVNEGNDCRVKQFKSGGIKPLQSNVPKAKQEPPATQEGFGFNRA